MNSENEITEIPETSETPETSEAPEMPVTTGLVGEKEKTGGIPKGIRLFLMGFLMYVIAALPILIRHGGLFFYYGDYNVQQVPFYILAHRAVRSGHFLWNWKTSI